jgi:hypothetical protein
LESSDAEARHLDIETPSWMLIAVTSFEKEPSISENIPEKALE